MPEFASESPIDGFLGPLTATVHDPFNVDPDAPQTIIQTGKHWSVHINWKTFGPANAMVGGSWHLHAYLESVGPGPDLDLIDSPPPTPTDHVIPLTPSSSAEVAYSAHLDVPAGTVTAPLAGRIFKLVVTLTYFDLLGGPGPMAAYVEGPIVQFYNP
jgi:hypothetical protein